MFALLRARVHHAGCLASNALPPFPKVICSLYILQLSLKILKKNKLYSINVKKMKKGQTMAYSKPGFQLENWVSPSILQQKKKKPCSWTYTDSAFICITGCKIGWGVAELWEVWCPHSRAGTAQTLSLSPAAHGAHTQLGQRGNGHCTRKHQLGDPRPPPQPNRNKYLRVSIPS